MNFIEIHLFLSVANPKLRKKYHAMFVNLKQISEMLHIIMEKLRKGHFVSEQILSPCVVGERAKLANILQNKQQYFEYDQVF